MTNREEICKQQIHCLSCPLSVLRTGKDCRELTHKELIELVVREPDNLCVCCGAQIPEGTQVCPQCNRDTNESLHTAVEDIYAAYCEKKREIEKLQSEIERLKREKLQLLNALAPHDEEEYID